MISSPALIGSTYYQHLVELVLSDDKFVIRLSVGFEIVEHASSSADAEAVEVAKECLTEAFKIDSSAVDSQPISNLLLEIFTKLEVFGHQGDTKSVQTRGVNSSPASTSPVADKSHIFSVEASKSEEGSSESNSSTSGLSKDDLCAQFFAALEKIHFFKQNVDGHCDSNHTDMATRYFHDATIDMESGTRNYNLTNLAESLKSQGNKAMQSKAYYDAIELYTCAIAVFDTNAVYYCNRAAAFTYVHKYSEAVVDCLKSIEIDPNYSKAYSRLGLAYYAQGNYGAAISKGFRKALQLDPNNESVRENIRVAEQKLNEEMQRARHYQNDTSASFGYNSQQSNGFQPMSFDASRIPVEVASIVSNLSSNISQHISRDEPYHASNGTGFSIPDINSGNFNVSLDGQMPQELMGSVMSMFSGAAQRGTGQNNPSSCD